MKNPKRLLLPLALGVALAACQNEPIKEGSIMQLDLDGIEEVEPAYTLSHLVPLETSEDNLLGEYLQVKIHGKDIFVYDEKARDAIHHFDKEGKYHGKAVEVGEAPGMVSNIHDFVPTDSGLEVLAGMGEFSKIIVLDKNFELDKEIELGYLGSSFEKLPNGNYVLSGSYNLPLVEHRVALFNGAGEKLKEFLPNDYSNQMIPMQERNFYKAGGRVFFHEVFNPVAYEIREDSLEARFRFDFGSYAIPAQFWEVDIMQGFEMINKNGFANIYSYWENGSTAFFEIFSEKNVHGGGETKNHQVVWDKERKKAVQRIFSKDGQSAFYHPIGLTGDHLVFMAQAAYLLDLKTDISTEGIDKDDNPVLLFVSLKTGL